MQRSNARRAAAVTPREDFPDRDDENWMKHSVVWLDEKGGTRIDYRPVHSNTMTNEVQAIPPKERVY